MEAADVLRSGDVVGPPAHRRDAAVKALAELSDDEIGPARERHIEVEQISCGRRGWNRRLPAPGLAQLQPELRARAMSYATRPGLEDRARNGGTHQHPGGGFVEAGGDLSQPDPPPSRSRSRGVRLQPVQGERPRVLDYLRQDCPVVRHEPCPQIGVGQGRVPNRSVGV